MKLCSPFKLSVSFFLHRGSNPEIILGAHSSSKREESQQIFRPAKLVPYPCFDQETLDNDIMLLQVQFKKNAHIYNKC